MNTHNPNPYRSGQFRQGFVRPDGEAQAGATCGQPGVRTLTSESLFLGGHEIGINHGGSLYRLKITRQGKLILNK